MVENISFTDIHITNYLSHEMLTDMFLLDIFVPQYKAYASKGHVVYQK